MVDPVIEARRQLYIERLYERAGRSCSTYSGLLQEHIQKLLQEDMDRVLADESQKAFAQDNNVHPANH